MDDVIAEIAAERRRQVEQEGWTAEHDDSHDGGELALAAAAYAYAATLTDEYRRYVSGSFSIRNNELLRSLWPSSWTGWWKPKTRRRDLIRSAALIVAEIERLDRAAS